MMTQSGMSYINQLRRHFNTENKIGIEMNDYLNRGVKEIIDAYPELADILNDYGIGCSACEVGTCLFKDIVSLHPISEDQEAELLKRVAAVINPD